MTKRKSGSGTSKQFEHSLYMFVNHFSRGFKQDCPEGNLGKDKILDMYSMILPAGNAKVRMATLFSS